MNPTLITKKELLKKLDISTGVLADLIRNGMPKEGEMFNLDKIITWRENWSKNILGELEVGRVYTNKEISEKFKCSKQGGMRRSHQTNTLVLFSDQTGSNVYKDKWLNGILQYTGMGLKGDQVLDKNQNKVLANSKSNFVKIHLFETFKPKEHTYLGEVYLAGQIYTVNEKDSSGNSRKVYKFPLALINQEQLIEDKDIYNQEENQTRHIRNLSDAKLEEEARKVSNYNKKMAAKYVNEEEFCFSKTKIYKRNPFVSEYVKRLAKGICQLCQEKGPFIKDGVPYLHCHHIEYLSQGGKDVIENCIALCPNCHARIHELELPDDKEKLLKIVEKRENSFSKIP
ncbi:hypothetical protein SCW_01495 [Enterococcus faecium EnGen0131]|uniref:HNH endonuclease n=4 Tax=Enterococcus faecium TaxID=1352 RepID=UPI0003309671|nr:HNH endonuclease signature motif containing protein [Enterococcus faecium]EOF54189.1 hypothetical protein SCW_01495 [Enterococcus faecium EnGen0131]MDT2332277.1 HNH endonuclease signature motif containing protein [Enterococcus faecium]MDV7756522.1 HNH endonuclease signature motif containing protein [Enterococcus faecium]